VALTAPDATSSHLFRRGRIWSVRAPVPAVVVGVIGRAECAQGLGTTDLAEARRCLPNVLSPWHAAFDAVRARSAAEVASPDGRA
jgi:hypothetical protein